MASTLRGLVRALVVGAALASACAGPTGPASPRVYRVGWLASATQADTAAVDPFRQAMREIGYVEGQNLIFDVRYADGYIERLPALAAELIALKPDVLVGRDPREVSALKQATTTIPIVMGGTGTDDPVRDGFVVSLGQPGGNVTGSISGPSIVPRRLQLLKEAIPSASRLALLVDTTISNPAVKDVQAAVSAIGLELTLAEVRSPADFASAFAAVRNARPDALYIGGGGLIGSQRQTVLDFLAANRLAATASARTFMDAGAFSALMYYATDLTELERLAAGYVDRIVKGAKPADLPVQAATKFELLINMRTARTLGLAIPPGILSQATEVIQ